MFTAQLEHIFTAAQLQDAFKKIEIDKPNSDEMRPIALSAIKDKLIQRVLYKALNEHFDKYGTRVNYSVYEIELNRTKYLKLLEEIEEKKLINKKYDSIRFYHICENCMEKSFDLSNAPDPFTAKEMFI